MVLLTEGLDALNSQPRRAGWVDMGVKTCMHTHSHSIAPRRGAPLNKTAATCKRREQLAISPLLHSLSALTCSFPLGKFSSGGGLKLCQPSPKFLGEKSAHLPMGLMPPLLGAGVFGHRPQAEFYLGVQSLFCALSLLH